MRRRTRRKHPRRRTRQRRKGGSVSPAFLESLHGALTDIFAGYHYLSKVKEEDIEIELYCEWEENENENDPSGPGNILLTLNPERVYVDLIRRCPTGPLTGSEIIRRIIQLGRRLSIPSVELSDGSTVAFPPDHDDDPACTVSLADIQILTTAAHHSWYNSFGFRSSQYAEEVTHNTAIANMSFITWIEWIAKSRRKTAMQNAQRHLTIARREGNSTEMNRFSRQLASIQGSPLEPWEEKVEDDIDAAFPELKDQSEDLRIQDAARYMVSVIRVPHIDYKSLPVRCFVEAMRVIGLELLYNPMLTLTLSST